MKMIRHATVIAAVLLLVFCISACSKSKEQDIPDAPLTSTWLFTDIESQDFTSSRTEWERNNSAFPEEATPIPEFSCTDTDTCVFSFNGSDHEGSLCLNEDGTYDIINIESEEKWGSASIEGNSLRLVLGDDVAVLSFEATAP